MSIGWAEHFNFEIFSQTTPQKFSGFVTVAKLSKESCRQAPEQPGVYMVYSPSCNCPRFCNPGSGGHFRGKDPNVTLEKLKEKWVEKAHIIYIGKAGSANSKATLRSRLTPYMRFGEEKPVPHWGGRYLWQVPYAKACLVAWRAIPGEESRKYEKELLKGFKKCYAKLPFANLCG